MARVQEGDHKVLPATHTRTTPQPQSVIALWLVVTAPTDEGMARLTAELTLLADWLHTEIDPVHRELNAETVTHPSTNRARRMLTALIETNALPLRQTATVSP